MDGPFLGFAERARTLRRVGRLLREDAELARVISAETGKPEFEEALFQVA